MATQIRIINLPQTTSIASTYTSEYLPIESAVAANRGSVPLRKNYAGIGFTYDPVLDAFYSPQPYPSWTLNTTTCLWEAPVSYPSDGKVYVWDESPQAWKLSS